MFCADQLRHSVYSLTGFVSVQFRMHFSVQRRRTFSTGSTINPWLLIKSIPASFMIGVDSLVTDFNLIVSGILLISSALTSFLRTIAPVSITIVARVSLIFPGEEISIVCFFLN